jgi:8-oxo-dGTP pyrophosphatase MutT (NUDIX family)
MKKAYGGIVIDPSGQVLLREPTRHYKGDVWTFPKGKPESGESPEQTAVREVLEETGYRAEIIAKIPGSFDGSRTSNEYFLMVPVEDTELFDAETQAVRWATGEEAPQLIQLNQKPKRRRRNLRVLKLALALFRSLEPALQLSDATQPQLQPFGTNEPQ